MSTLKKLRDRLLYSLWIPFIWALALFADIVSFTDARPTSLPGRLFEDVVFAMSFLFFKPDMSARGHTFWTLFPPLFLQFFFWWVVNFFILSVLKIPREKSSL